MHFLRRLLSSCDLKILPLSPLPACALKYHFAESTTTVLANCSKKRRVEVCVMKSHIRKQSLRKLLSSYYLRIFRFSHWAPMHFQYQLADTTKRLLANCFLRSKLKVCEMNSMIPKKFLRKLLSRFELMIFPSSA